jgi:O-antigen/teichoic acid export membrane protein
VNLIKTSFYTSISTAITFISGFIVVKVVALKIGPKGIAFIGQFQNTTAIFAMLASAAIATGIVKYLAEHKNDPEKSKKIINTAFIIVFFCSIIISILDRLFFIRIIYNGYFFQFNIFSHLKWAE